MLLLIDNYDSFTYNLVHYFEQLAQQVSVYRHDAISLQDIEALQPDYMVLSPGPGRPEDAGITLDCIRHFAGKLPLLGVCLGHQAIGQAFGANIIHAQKVMHGKTSRIYYHNHALFQSLANPFIATRYHSLLIDRNTLSDDFTIIAWTEDQEIMAIAHRTWPLFGVQFHPEAIETQQGLTLLKNFLELK